MCPVCWKIGIWNCPGQRMKGHFDQAYVDTFLDDLKMFFISGLVNPRTQMGQRQFLESLFHKYLSTMYQCIRFPMDLSTVPPFLLGPYRQLQVFTTESNSHRDGSKTEPSIVQLGLLNIYTQESFEICKHPSTEARLAPGSCKVEFKGLARSILCVANPKE